MPAAMELRKHIKAPRRYSRELEEESHPETRPSKPSPIKAKIINYNPHLPPAAFPTLDPRQVLARDNNLPDNHVSGNNDKHARGPTTLSSAERDLTAESASPHLHRPQTASVTQKTPPGMDNGPGNLIWEKNMKLMNELDERTEEEWFIKECETSSDEEAANQTASNKNRLPVWDTIPLALQIEMVYAAIGDDTKPDRAMARLRLNETQREIMKEELRLYQEREGAEDAYIASHQGRLNEILLSGRRSQLDQDLFKDLYQNIDSMKRNDTVASRAEVNDAKAYMESCGLDSSELDNFQPAGNVPYMITESDEELERLYPNAPTIREVMAAEAAARGALPDEAAMSQPEPPNAEVSLLLPNENDADGEILENEANEVLPVFKRRKVTGDTIEVDVGDQSFLGNNAIQVMTDSIPEQGNAFGDDYPQTPQQITGQEPNFDVTSTAANRSIEWPATPPTPSLGAVPVLDSSGSDYDPNPKSKRTVISSRKAVLTPNFGPASEASATPKARKMAGQLPVLSPKAVGQNGKNVGNKDQAHQGLAMGEGAGYVWGGTSTVGARSSSATTEQDSTILVDVPGQQSTAAQQAGGTGDTTMGGTGTTERKTKKRGRPKQSKG
ncbi:MAG: hypothetical protein LQ343_001206 [Gyalolechia ehrenbergii]|nr:MAG: hypothetical protein LQ343_001206 [Gyalolechia ehrenbergii]